jgi:hypothetical protein
MDGTDLLGNKNDKYFVNGKQKYGAWEKGRVYEAPIYVGWNAGGRHVTMGYSSRWVQDRIQNALHRSGVPFTNLGHQSFYNDYSQMYEGWFSNSGSINNLSLW